MTCRSCGLVQQNPRPLREAVLSRYDESYLAYEIERQFDYAALEWRALEDLGFPGLESGLVERLRGEGRRPRALDIGCATGALLDSLARRGWDCTGLEACEPAARYGRGRFGLDLRHAVLEEAGFEDGRFDLVHASHLIEHLNEPVAFLAQVLRVVAPGGLVILTTPNIDGFQARLLGSRWRSAIYDHLFLLSRRHLDRMLREAGARVLRVATWGGWAAGLRPAALKKPLDRAAKRLGWGDVMAFLCVRASG